MIIPSIILISDKSIDKNPHQNPYMKAFDLIFIYFLIGDQYNAKGRQTLKRLPFTVYDTIRILLSKGHADYNIHKLYRKRLRGILLLVPFQVSDM